MAYNISQKLHDNLRAIHIALDYQNGGLITAEDVANLTKYAGFGGIKAVLYPFGAQEEWRYQRRLEAPRGNNATPWLAQRKLFRESL